MVPKLAQMAVFRHSAACSLRRHPRAAVICALLVRIVPHEQQCIIQTTNTQVQLSYFWSAICEAKTHPSWPGLTRPPIARASASDRVISARRRAPDGWPPQGRP
jgi:hypothetical protein